MKRQIWQFRSSRRSTERTIRTAPTKLWYEGTCHATIFQ